MKKQKLPKWFDGNIYTNGGVVKNNFSGEKYYLNNIELTMYDYIKGSEYLMSTFTDKEYDQFYEGLDWFKKNNAKAYMVLLD